MKRCPTCRRTFEDTLTYCLVDGTILSAPFDPERPEQEDATSVLPSAETIAALSAPSPQSTMTAMYQPAAPQPGSTVSSQSPKKSPSVLIVITALVTVVFLAVIVVFTIANGREVGPYLSSVLTRRVPLLLFYAVGIVLALARIRRHSRVSMMTVLALLVLPLEAITFSLIGYWLPSVYVKVNLSSTAVDWLYVVLYFFEDLVFSAAIFLLVAAAYSERTKLLNPTTETL